MTELLFHAHSGLRYLVLVAGAATFVYALVGWLRRRPFTRTADVLGRVFIGLLDLQVVLGVILVFSIFYGQLIGHIVMMVLAAATAHGFAIAQKRRSPAQKTFALQCIGVGITLLLIIAGIAAIGRPIL